MKSLAVLTSLLLITFLSACGPRMFRADVTQFHDTQDSFQGRSFILVAKDKAKADSLEFSRYADLAVREMVARGMDQAPDAESAQVVAMLDYVAGEAEDASYSVPVHSTVGYHSGYGHFGRGHSHFGTGIGYYGPVYYRDIQRTLFRHEVTLSIVDADAWRRNKIVALYEGRSVARVETDERTRVVPLLIRTLFQAFPGGDGQTVEVEIPLEDAPVNAAY
jgi:hypothetical protein